MRRGPLTAGEKVQFTDRRSNKITDQLVPGGVTQTSHGIILHDDVICLLYTSRSHGSQPRRRLLRWPRVRARP